MNEWKTPLAILIMSSLIFTAATFFIGIRINRLTGETEIEMMTELKENGETDPWVYDPMTIVWGSTWRYWCIAGYYGALAVFTVAWFEFMKQEKEQKRKDMKQLGLTRVRPRDIENIPFFPSNCNSNTPNEIKKEERSKNEV